MKRISVVISLILIFINSAIRTPGVHAQGVDLSLHLALPNEGETFYAGPSTLLYMIPISGLVESSSFTPDQITLEVAIFQKGALVTSAPAFPDAEGKFEIYAEVNPGAYSQVFAAEFIPCGDVCHFNAANQFQKNDWIASLELPPGQMQVIVTATDPAGQSTRMQRNITVDHSNYATVPVQIVTTDNQPLAKENIPVTGTTWLYMWRSRFVTGGTDANGLAYVKVEALSETPTTYRFQVMTSVMGGVLYESVKPVEITLPPGTLEGPPIKLQVKITPGIIHGEVKGDIPLHQMKIWAIQLPGGKAETTQVSSDGSFSFENIPIEKYAITTDSELLANQNLVIEDVNIDLAKNVSAMVELFAEPLEGKSCQGAVIDSDGNWLPFAWVSIEKMNIVMEAMPDSGQFSLHGLPEQKSILMVNAPGYYSKAQVIDLSREDSALIDIQLNRRPETKSIQWGDGEITVPPETRISSSGGHIFLERGWLWGSSNISAPITIQTGGKVINLSSGKFALEDVPGQASWFYLFEGDGKIILNDGMNEIPIRTGEMISLDEVQAPSAVPYGLVAVKVFHKNDRVPLTPIIEPTFTAQLANRLALLGIDFVRLITFVTYGFIFISSILFPIMLIYLWGRQNLIHKKEKRASHEAS